MQTLLDRFSLRAGVRCQREYSFNEHQAASSEAARRIRRILFQSMRRSRRNGSWYKLGRLDRTLFGLALRLKVKFKSPMLLRFIVGVLKRLRELGDSVYIALQRGTPLAWRFSEAAVRWGNIAAEQWRNDRAYALFLGAFVSHFRAP